MDEKHSMKSVGIVGVGSYLPKRVMTNFELEKMVDTSDEWIVGKTGIKTRHIANKTESTSDLAFEAAKKAMEDAGINAFEIDLIIIATATPDMIFPSTACILQGKLNAKNAAAFDVVALCAGFVYALETASKFITDGTYKTVLVIGAETYSRILDWKDRTTCVFFGDGAGAVILKEVPAGKGLLSSYLMSDGKRWDVIKFPAGGSKLPASYETIKNNQHRFEMDGPRVWDFAVEAFPGAVRGALKKADLSVNDVDFLISHQANINLIKHCMELTGVPINKTYTNLHKYGNTSAASIPIALDEALKLGKIKNGDILVLVAFGGGLAWGANVIKWWKK